MATAIVSFVRLNFSTCVRAHHPSGVAELVTTNGLPRRADELTALNGGRTGIEVGQLVRIR